VIEGINTMELEIKSIDGKLLDSGKEDKQAEKAEDTDTSSMINSVNFQNVEDGGILNDQNLSDNASIEGQHEETHPQTMGDTEDSDLCTDCIGNDGNIKNGSKGFMEETILHFIEVMKDFVPDWLHKSFHWQYVEGRLVILLTVLSVSLIALHIIQLFADKISKEKPLKAKIASLDKALFKSRNNEMIIRRELDEARSKLSFKETTASSIDDFTTTTVVDSITTESPSRSHFHQPPAQLVKEMEALRAEKDKVEKENDTVLNCNKEIIQRIEAKSQEVCTLQSQLDQSYKEL
jgi:hypothetical protein